ncbi:MAG: hypothetical protein COC10_08975, partial [Sphingobium sp.]
MAEPYALLAEFDSPERLMDAARRLREQGWRRLEAFTPFPVEGLDRLLGFTDDKVARAMRPHLVERVAGLRQRLFLVRQHRQPLVLHPAYIGCGAPIAFNRAGLRGCHWPIGHTTLRRRRFLGYWFRPEPREHTPRLVANLLHDLAREFREPDLAPIGERPRLIL